jgi:hypothetical protein
LIPKDQPLDDHLRGVWSCGLDRYDPDDAGETGRERSTLNAAQPISLDLAADELALGFHWCEIDCGVQAT